jgi:hypothetical protein
MRIPNRAKWLWYIECKRYDHQMATPSLSYYGLVLVLRRIDERKALARLRCRRKRLMARNSTLLAGFAPTWANNLVLTGTRCLFARRESFLTHSGYSVINGPTYPCCCSQPVVNRWAAMVSVKALRGGQIHCNVRILTKSIGQFIA